MKQMEWEMRRKDRLFPMAAESCPEILSLTLYQWCYTAMARELPGTQRGHYYDEISKDSHEKRHQVLTKLKN